MLTLYKFGTLSFLDVAKFVKQEVFFLFVSWGFNGQVNNKRLIRKPIQIFYFIHDVWASNSDLLLKSIVSILIDKLDWAVSN